MGYYGSSSPIEPLLELICYAIQGICEFFRGMTVTLREVIFSILIIGILGSIGFYAASSIEKKVMDSQLAYRQAVQISDTNEFAHAMATDVGMALVEGDFKTLDPVSHEKCNGKWLKITADYQEYRMHVQHYTTTDSKGRTHHHTRTYWSWDTYDVKRIHARDVMFCGSKFCYEQFDYGVVGAAHRQTVGNGHNHRIVFSCLPAAFHATIASDLHGNEVHGKPLLLEGYDLAKAYEHYTTSHAVLIFWCCWSVGILLVCLVFYRYENEWLEDS